MRFSLRALFIFVAAVAVLCWLGRSFNSVEKDRLRSESARNLREIGDAILNYQPVRRHRLSVSVVDSNGTPLCSWRFSILRLDDSMVPAFPDPSRPWNHPRNAVVSAQPADLFHAPLDDSVNTMTSYLAVVGDGAAWTSQEGLRLDQIKHPEMTIIVIEVFKSGINWAEPRDISVVDAVATLHDHGGNVLFADGHVENLPAGADVGTLRKMMAVR